MQHILSWQNCMGDFSARTTLLRLLCITLQVSTLLVLLPSYLWDTERQRFISRRVWLEVIVTGLCGLSQVTNESAVTLSSEQGLWPTGWHPSFQGASVQVKGLTSRFCRKLRNYFSSYFWDTRLMVVISRNRARGHSTGCSKGRKGCCNWIEWRQFYEWETQQYRPVFPISERCSLTSPVQRCPSECLKMWLELVCACICVSGGRWETECLCALEAGPDCSGAAKYISYTSVHQDMRALGIFISICLIGLGTTVNPVLAYSWATAAGQAQLKATPICL